MSPEPQNSAEVFFSFAHEDEELREEFEKHLSNLRRQGVISNWYDRDISTGNGWDEDIAHHLNSAQVILLLVSPDFMNSDYVNDVEMKRAMERHEAGEARVIPVILRPVDWAGAPFSNLQALPTDAKAVTLWNNQDEAFLTVAKAIRTALKELKIQPAPDSTLAQIPRPPTVGFVARRDREGRDIIERLKDELAPQRNQLVVLSGAGGVGKTTLAEEALRALSATFQHRVVLTSTLGRDDYSFSTLLDEIITQLGHAELRALPPDKKAEQVYALVMSAATLIILDNFETIESEEKSRCLDFLRRRVSCPALITSRERIDGAHNIEIPAMSPDEAKEFLDRLIGQASDRSVFAQVDRERIMMASERTPLVMEWIVGQIDLAQDPGTVLDELAHGGGDAAQRVFDRSFQLPQLGDDGRSALLALSLFVPHASRDALAQVADFGNNIQRLNKALKRLASLYLVRTVAQGSRLVVDGLSRALARRRLISDIRADEFSERFVAYFLKYSQSHSRPISEDYDALEAEKDNIVAAAELALSLKDLESTRRIVDTIANPVTGILMIRGYWDEAAKLTEQALTVSHGSETDTAVFSNNLAMMRANQGELDEARRLYNQSLEIEKSLGNEYGIAVTLHNLALISQMSGDLDEARRLYDQSLEIERSLSNESGIAVTLQQLGAIAQQQRQLEEAHHLYTESLAIKRKLGDQIGIINSLHQLGTLAEQRRELSEARRLFTESLEIARKLGDQRSIASILHNLASLAQHRDDLDEAEKLYEQSLDIKRRLGDPRGMASTLHNLALLARHKGDSERAGDLYEQSRRIGERLGDERIVESGFENLSAVEELEIQHQRAELLMGEGRWHEARAVLLNNKEEFKRLRNKSGFSRTLLALARSEHAIGDLERARWTYKDALDQFQSTDKRYAAITSAYLGRLELQTGLVKDALKHLEEAEKYFTQEQDHENLATVRQLTEAANQLAQKQSDDEDWFTRTKRQKTEGD